MPYDPTKPVALTEIDADLLRNQFNGLKDLIDAQQQVIDALQQQVNAQAAQIYGLTDMIQQKPDMPSVEGDTAGSVLAVDLLNLNVSDPPQQSDVQAIADKLDETRRHGKRLWLLA